MERALRLGGAQRPLAPVVIAAVAAGAARAGFHWELATFSQLREAAGELGSSTA